MKIITLILPNTIPDLKLVTDPEKQSWSDDVLSSNPPMTAIGDPKPDWLWNELMELEQLPTVEGSSRGINSATERLAPPRLLIGECKQLFFLKTIPRFNWELKLALSRLALGSCLARLWVISINLHELGHLLLLKNPSSIKIFQLSKGERRNPHVKMK